MKAIELIPKIPQYSDVSYAPDFVCPECHKSGFMRFGFEVPKSEPDVIGWAETTYGYMGIFECPYCGTKYRFHCSRPRTDIDKFDYGFVQYYARRCPNWWEAFGEKLGVKPIKVKID